jgi:hypothetical protein
MPSGKATRKAKAGIDYFYLQTSADVIPLITALLAIGFNATLHAYTVNGAANLDLQIDDTRPGADANPQDKTKIAHLGDVVVWDSGVARLSVSRIEDFQTNYSVP